jgi:glycosyltransferase involved in cell wall biosynthesis
MVRAFVILRETMKDAILVILGKGELEETVRREIGELLASDFILLKGRRPREEIPFWLAACDVVTLSSLDEGCPVIILEGFVSGKPFVGTAVGGVPEIVPDDSLGILAEPANPASLARALKTALEKRWDPEKLVQHGLRYSWENLGKRVSGVYAEVGRIPG